MMTSLFLVIGVLSPKTHFAVQISSLVMFLMLILFALNFTVISDPDSTMGFLLSLFPVFCTDLHDHTLGSEFTAAMAIAAQSGWNARNDLFPRLVINSSCASGQIVNRHFHSHVQAFTTGLN